MGISEVSTLELELQQELVETTVCRLGITEAAAFEEDLGLRQQGAGSFAVN